MRKQKIFIPYRPKTFNDLKGKHFRVFKQEADNIKTICRYVLTQLEEIDYPVIISFQPVLVRNNYQNKGAKEYDTINYAYAYKVIEDCLTNKTRSSIKMEKAILKDDTKKYVKGHFLKESIVDDGTNFNESGTIIILTEYTKELEDLLNII